MRGVLLSAAEAAQADLASLTGEIRGTVRAGGLQSATRRLLIPAVARMLTEQPQVHLEITELELEQALPELRLGMLDVVISDEYDGHPRPSLQGSGSRYCTRPLKLVLPAAHPASAHHGPVAIATLREDVWVASAAAITLSS